MYSPKKLILKTTANIFFAIAVCFYNPTTMADDAQAIVCCDGSASQHSTLPTSKYSAAGLSVDNSIEVSDADTPWRYVGISPLGICPSDLNNWSSNQLFALQQAELPLGLKRYCVFIANNMSMPVIAELNAQLCSTTNQSMDCLSRVDPDSAAMAMMGSDMADLMWQPLHQQFLEQVDPIDPIPPVAIPRARLTFIDTEPTGLDQDSVVSGVSQHGFTLLNLARDMLCPASISPSFDSCGVEINSQLGLPLRRCPSATGFCVNPSIGGHAGTISQLATAIRAAVHDASSTGRNQHVINLSVAWDPALSGGTVPSNSRAAVEATYRALQYASCQGCFGNSCCRQPSNRSNVEYQAAASCRLGIH